MRTTGTFQDVYRAAREYYTDDEAVENCPMKPAVRRVGGEWRIESGIHDDPDAELEVTLEAFDSYFYEGYKDPDYTPSDSDVTEWVDLLAD